MIHPHRPFDLTGAGIYLGALITSNLHEVLSITLLAVNLFYVAYQVVIFHKKNQDDEEL
jgi:hypothetical protein